MINISNEVAESLLKNSGKNLQAWQKAVDKGEIANAALEKIWVKAQTDLEFKKSTGINVLAKLAVPGARTAVTLGAHADHLGSGEQGNSLAASGEQERIHYGADDNASGVSALMQIARELSVTKNKSLKQNIMFAVWSGEEIGLLGSSHFIDEYLKNKKNEKITAYINMDMIGRLKKEVMIQGVGSANEWKSWIEKLGRVHPLSVSLHDDPYVPSDSMAFVLKDIPAITFFTGAHSEYHTPRDTFDTINFEGLYKISDFVRDLTVQAAITRGPTYKKVPASGNSARGSGGFRIYLGTIPDYTQDDAIKGVKISGTSKGSPAEKAGLQAGDVITELASTPVANLYDYMYCLQGLKANQETPLKVKRQGKLIELKILPIMRE